MQFFSYTQGICNWSLDLVFKAKLKLQSRNWKIQYGCQAAILKVTHLKINKLLSKHTIHVLLKFGLDIQSTFKMWKPKNPIWPPSGHFESDIIENQWAAAHATNNIHIKFAIEIPKQTWVMLQKPSHLQSPDTDKSNMATRWTFWKWHYWRSLTSFRYTQVMSHWSFDLIFKVKLKLKSGNWKI